MKKLIALQTTLFILFCSVTLSWGQQTISEEARRHFDRGLAAVEMAKTPADYEKAIQEFEKARSFAPSWPDVYFNLGMVQEKAEKYRDAIESLKQYIRLAPNAGDAEQVKTLINKLEYKAEKMLTPNVRTPLHEAAVKEKEDVNAKDILGRTPLHYAVSSKKDVAELLAKGADVNAKDDHGDTPLHDAVSSKKDVAELLIAKGADVNATNNCGSTPLHGAVRDGKKDVAELLIAKGADVNATNNYGYTPLHYAVSKGKKDVAELLEKHGARE